MPAAAQKCTKLRMTGPMPELPKVTSRKRGRPAGTAAASAASSEPSRGALVAAACAAVEASAPSAARVDCLAVPVVATCSAAAAMR